MRKPAPHIQNIAGDLSLTYIHIGVFYILAKTK